MKAQDFAERSASIFLYGLPIVVFGMPILATMLGNFAHGALPLVSPVLQGLAWLGYLGVPFIGFLGACVGIWCYFKKDYEHKVSKQILVLAILIAYVCVSSIAVQAYTSMKREAPTSAAASRMQ